MDKRAYKELSAKAANGNTKAFAQLYETVYREMYYAAYYSLINDADAVEVVTATVRDGFSAVGRLHTDAAFRAFMMKTLCARIKQKFREYSSMGIKVVYDKRCLRPNDDGIDIKQEFNRLGDLERLVTSLYVVGRFPPDEIAAYTGMTTGAVKRRMERSLEQFSLD